MQVKDIQPEIEINVTLAAGRRCHFRAKARKHVIPFKFRVETQKGAGFINLLISNKILRPNTANCDKAMLISSRETFSSYIGTKSKDNTFTDEYIYITIEADRETSLTFQYTFGMRNLLIYYHITIGTIKKRVEREIKVKHKDEKNVDQSDCLSDRNAIDSPRNTNKLNERPKTSMPSARKLRYVALTRTSNFKERCGKAAIVREQLEDDDIKRKFLMSHRREINRQHVSKHINLNLL